MCRIYLRCNLRDKIEIATDFNSIFFLYFHISRPTYNFQLNINIDIEGIVYTGVSIIEYRKYRIKI